MKRLIFMVCLACLALSPAKAQESTLVRDVANIVSYANERSSFTVYSGRAPIVVTSNKGEGVGKLRITARARFSFPNEPVYRCEITFIVLVENGEMQSTLSHCTPAETWSKFFQRKEDDLLAESAKVFIDVIAEIKRWLEIQKQIGGVG